jgi:hypothetical protein
MYNTDIKIMAVDARVRLERNRYNIFSKWMGSVKVGRDDSNNTTLTGSGSPIEVNSELKIQGLGDVMPIPMMLEYAGNGVVGDSVLEGNEEEDALLWTYVHYNTRRHAVKLDKGQQEDSREKFLKLKSQKAPALGRWAGKMENWDIVSAIYEGVSEHLSTATSSDGLGLSKRLHPYQYYWGSATSQAAGVLTKVTSAAAFPTGTEMHTGITSLVGYSYNKMSTYTLEALRVQCLTNNIKPIATKDGFNFWILLVSPTQASQLRADDNFKNAYNYFSGYKSLMENPMIVGAVGYYAGFAIFEDAVSVRGWYFSSQTECDVIGATTAYSSDTAKANPRFLPEYGNTITGTPTYAHANYAAIVLGESAVGKAVGEDTHMEENIKDYNNYRGLGVVAQYGYERLDYVATGVLTYLESAPTSVTSVKNESSLICITGIV